MFRNDIPAPGSRSAIDVYLAGYIRRPPSLDAKPPYAFLLQQTKALNHALPVYVDPNTVVDTLVPLCECCAIAVRATLESVPVDMYWTTNPAKLRWFPRVLAHRIETMPLAAYPNARLWNAGATEAHSPIDERFTPSFLPDEATVANNLVRLRGFVRHYFFESTNSADQAGTRERMVMMLATGPTLREIHEVRIKGPRAKSMLAQFKAFSADDLHRGIPVEVIAVLRTKVSPAPDPAPVHFAGRTYANVVRRPYLLAQDMILDPEIVREHPWWTPAYYGAGYVDEGRTIAQPVDPIALGPVFPCSEPAPQEPLAA